MPGTETALSACHHLCSPRPQSPDPAAPPYSPPPSQQAACPLTHRLISRAPWRPAQAPCPSAVRGCRPGRGALPEPSLAAAVPAVLLRRAHVCFLCASPRRQMLLHGCRSDQSYSPRFLLWAQHSPLSTWGPRVSLSQAPRRMKRRFFVGHPTSSQRVPDTSACNAFVVMTLKSHTINLVKIYPALATCL